MFRLPLYGLRVLELAAGWAGPYASRLLADMGAEVIKVESPHQWDPTRSWPAKPSAEEGAWNRSPCFNHLNRNKYGLGLDVSHPQGRQLFLRLVALCDVVIENFSAEARASHGLSPKALRQARADIVLVSIATRPEQGHSYHDLLAGVATAGAVALALWYRRHTGQGQHVQVDGEKALINVAGERILAYSVRARRGQRPSRMAPHGCYPCQGGQWVALACQDDQQFAALCAVLGQPALAQDARYADVVARHSHRKELEEIVASWTRQQTKEEAAAALQAVGVAAAPVLSVAEVLADPHLRARGFFEPVAHPEAGVWDLDSSPWLFSETSAHVRLPAPGFGQHNDYVLRYLLGLTDREVEALAQAGVIADRPHWPP